MFFYFCPKYRLLLLVRTASYICQEEQNHVYPCKPQFYYIKSGLTCVCVGGGGGGGVRHMCMLAHNAGPVFTNFSFHSILSSQSLSSTNKKTKIVNTCNRHIISKRQVCFLLTCIEWILNG